MSGTLKNIIQRHLQQTTSGGVQPRLPGIFEHRGANPSDSGIVFPETAETNARLVGERPPDVPPENAQELRERSGFRTEHPINEPLTPDTSFPQNIFNSTPPVIKQHTGDQETVAVWGKTLQTEKITTSTEATGKFAASGIGEKQDDFSPDFTSRINYVKALSGNPGNIKPRVEAGATFPLVPRAIRRVENWRQNYMPVQVDREKTEAPAINVHIGSIEIRAIKAPPSTARNTAPVPKPAMSLEQYINERKG